MSDSTRQDTLQRQLNDVLVAAAAVIREGWVTDADGHTPYFVVDVDTAEGLRAKLEFIFKTMVPKHLSGGKEIF